MMMASTVVFSRGAKGDASHLSRSKRLPQILRSSTSAFPLPSHQTQVGRWQHANPALAGPLQCQFPP